jgi:hypothetical protein
MLESQPATSPGTTFGLLALIGLVLLDVGLLIPLLGGQITVLSSLSGLLLMGSLPLLLLIAYWTSSLRAARYHVENQLLWIEWGSLRQVIPLAAIQSLELGQNDTAVTRFRGLRWPGMIMGQGQIQGKSAYIFAARPAAEQLLVHTDTAVYAISPVDLANFTDCLEALRAAHQGEPSDLPPSRLGFLEWRFWDDRLAQLFLAASVVLNGALFVYLTAVYGRLPAQVPLHFDQAGNVDRLAAPGNLFVLPIIGLMTWTLNGVGGWLFYQQKHRLPAYLLWGTAVTVQLAAWGALFGLLA